MANPQLAQPLADPESVHARSGGVDPPRIVAALSWLLFEDAFACGWFWLLRGLACWELPELWDVVTDRWLDATTMATTAAVALVNARLAYRAVAPIGHPEHPACGECGYNLTGNLSGVCPECGTPCGRGLDAAAAILPRT